MLGRLRQPLVVGQGRRVDFDLGQVRAFVAVADQLHFGRAAGQLYLTQQALSRRVQRLEQHLGEALFIRDGRAVALTEAGRRFLPHARELLAVATDAAAATRLVARPLRVDVWGQIHAPLLIIRRLAEAVPGLLVETSMRRGLPLALEALRRDEVDVAFGRVHDLGVPWPPSLRHRLAQLTPSAAIVAAAHPLAGRSSIRPADLAAAGSELWVQDSGTSPEVHGYLRRFAERFGLPMHRGGSNLGIEQVLGELAASGTGACLLPAYLELPPTASVRLLPVTGPVARFPWSVIWRADDRGPALAAFLRQLSELSRDERWTRFDPDADWLPEPDRADL
jgi:DNA-binding transcriptional LysR family regulator